MKLNWYAIAIIVVLLFGVRITVIWNCECEDT